MALYSYIAQYYAYGFCLLNTFIPCTNHIRPMEPLILNIIKSLCIIILCNDLMHIRKYLAMYVWDDSEVTVKF